MAKAKPHPTAEGPIRLADHGWFYAGGEYVERDGKPLLRGAMYVERFVPEKQTQPYPVVMIHGNGQTGTNFTGTPDGRRGWAHDFLRAGYTVYVADQPARGRSPQSDALYGTSEMPPFGAADNPAHQHIAPYYIEGSEEDIHIPNVVTTVLGSYRGYDTMGETAVIFAAIVGVLLLLSTGPLPRRVFHDGKWITVRPGTTREDLEDALTEQERRASLDGGAEASEGDEARSDGEPSDRRLGDGEALTDG